MRNLHSETRPPLIINTARPTTDHLLTPNERLIQTYATLDDTARFGCSDCGNQGFRRRLTEVWERTETVNFLTGGEGPEVEADRSSAEWYDDNDDEPWICTLCEGTGLTTDLTKLLNDLEKEDY